MLLQANSYNIYRFLYNFQEMQYHIIKEGRSFTKIQFSIQLRSDMKERFTVWKNIEDIIGDSRNKVSKLVQN